MNIRTAQADDSTAIRHLLKQLGYPNLSKTDTAKKIDAYAEETYRLLVTEVDHEVVGFISLHWFDIFHSPGKIGRITAFCIDERFRSKGLGKQLLLAAEEFLISKGCTKLEVTSNERRTLTHQFYLKCGYVEDSRRFVKYPKVTS